MTPCRLGCTLSQPCAAQTRLGYPCPGFAITIVHQTARCFWHAPRELPQKPGATTPPHSHAI